MSREWLGWERLAVVELMALNQVGAVLELGRVAGNDLGLGWVLGSLEGLGGWEGSAVLALEELLR